MANTLLFKWEVGRGNKRQGTVLRVGRMLVNYVLDLVGGGAAIDSKMLRRSHTRELLKAGIAACDIEEVFPTAVVSPGQPRRGVMERGYLAVSRIGWDYVL